MAPTTAERMEKKFTDPEYRENTFFLEEKSSGKLIGAVFLEDDDLRYGVASKSVSYFLDEAYSQKGYMKEAMQALLAKLFWRSTPTMPVTLKARSPAFSSWFWLRPSLRPSSTL